MRRGSVGLVVVIALVGAVGLRLLGAADPVPQLVVLAAAILGGEAFELRPPGRLPLPMSYAIFLVLGRVGSPMQVVATVLAAEFFAAMLRPGSVRVRAEVFVWRSATAVATAVSFRFVGERVGSDTTLDLLFATAVACVVMFVVHEVGSGLIHARASFSFDDRWADLALVTCGALMALGYGGVDGSGEMGVWAIVFFAIPLFAAWYSFERLASARETYWQTIHALSLAPELGGVVHAGHSERVADLSLELGRALDLGFRDLETLEAAAHLHHIGDLCVDIVPRDGVYPDPDPFDAVEMSVQILRDTGHLSAVADVVEAVPTTYRTPGSGRPSAGGLPGAILKAASAYDELAETEAQGPNRALALLYSSPAYVYDPRVLSELEHVLHRRGEAVPDD